MVANAIAMLCVGGKITPSRTFDKRDGLALWGFVGVVDERAVPFVCVQTKRRPRCLRRKTIAHKASAGKRRRGRWCRARYVGPRSSSLRGFRTDVAARSRTRGCKRERAVRTCRSRGRWVCCGEPQNELAHRFRFGRANDVRNDFSHVARQRVVLQQQCLRPQIHRQSFSLVRQNFARSSVEPRSPDGFGAHPRLPQKTLGAIEYVFVRYKKPAFVFAVRERHVHGSLNLVANAPSKLVVVKLVRRSRHNWKCRCYLEVF